MIRCNGGFYHLFTTRMEKSDREFICAQTYPKEGLFVVIEKGSRMENGTDCLHVIRRMPVVLPVW